MESAYKFRIAAVVTPILLGIAMTCLIAQDAVPTKADRSMFRAGNDIPAGVPHGTWDFDEWPGVSHEVMYKRNFMYNAFPNEKIKIDYFLSSFGPDDYKGYLRTPEELKAHGFIDMGAMLEAGRNKGGVIVGIFAHPDDEVLLAGGCLAYAAANGWTVRVYLVSNGADGSEGQSDGPTPDLGGYNAYGVTKEGGVMVQTDNAGIHKLAIIEDYARVLGVTIRVLPMNLAIDGKKIVQFGEAPGLDFDRTFGSGTDARNEIRTRIEEAITADKPAMVFTHGADGEYGNYMHKLIHDIVQGVASDRAAGGATEYYTCFPEYNYRDHITHYLSLAGDNGKFQTIKWNALKKITFLYKPGTDYDKPWDPNDDLMDGAFVKDYGYTPTDGIPPPYEFFQKLEL